MESEDLKKLTPFEKMEMIFELYQKLDKEDIKKYFRQHTSSKPNVEELINGMLAIDINDIQDYIKNYVINSKHRDKSRAFHELMDLFTNTERVYNSFRGLHKVVYQEYIRNKSAFELSDSEEVDTERAAMILGVNTRTLYNYRTRKINPLPFREEKEGKKTIYYYKVGDLRLFKEEFL
jgi:hypothetical protein